MKIDGTDIIAGLEEAFFKIFQFGSDTTQDVLQSRITPASRPRRSTLALQSLFVLWQDLYNGLPTLYKTHWTLYWETLPFGVHAGLHGWPGSGFSAFVYLNAPRYKNNEDLILDPYPGVNIIPNGDFSSGDAGWSKQHVVITDRAIFDPAFIASIITIPNFHGLQAGHTYNFKCYMQGSFGNVIVGVTFVGTVDTQKYANYNVSNQLIDFTFTILTGGGDADAFVGDNTLSDAIILLMSLVDIT